MSHGAPCAQSVEEYPKLFFSSPEEGGLNLSHPRRRREGRILLEAPSPGSTKALCVILCEFCALRSAARPCVCVCATERTAACCQVLETLFGLGRGEKRLLERIVLLTDAARPTPRRFASKSPSYLQTLMGLIRR